MTLHFILATHNRRGTTRRCLLALLEAVQRANVGAAVVVFDDGSTDGTVDEVRAVAPHAVVQRGDGKQFWAASMAQAERKALEAAVEGDVIVWLNDDVVLDSDAIRRLTIAIDQEPQRVLVGSARDPKTGSVTYGGLLRAGRHPLGFSLLDPPALQPQSVDTFNGNLVCVPVSVIARLGGIDGRFAHAGADVEYGLRVGAAGEPALLLPGTFGTCSRNPARPRGTFGVDFRAFVGPKGGGNPRTLWLLLGLVTPRPRIWMALTYLNWFRKRLIRAEPTDSTGAVS